jgi:mRNA-degrading endonuclease RelE of RelBE toxin-antitoxin system
MRYSRPGQYSISYHDDVERDLDAIYEVDPESGDEIVAFLDEVQASEELLDRFSSEAFRSPRDPAFDVDRWGSMWRNYALWRVKLLYTNSEASRYRIIYTYHPTERRYYILAIVHRDQLNYDDANHPIRRRIVDAYRSLDIP